MRWDVARDLDAAHGLPRSSLVDTLFRTETWRDIERGIGDPGDWRAAAHRELETRAGRTLPPLHDEWRKAQVAIGPNLELARSLRRDFKLSILSNADLSLRHRLEQELAIHDLFDDIVCSAEVGLAKPDHAVFRLACERLGLTPAACVFVDDHEPNVDAAREVGMSALLFRVDRGDDLAAQLRTVGVAAR